MDIVSRTPPWFSGTAGNTLMQTLNPAWLIACARANVTLEAPQRTKIIGVRSVAENCTPRIARELVRAVDAERQASLQLGELRLKVQLRRRERGAEERRLQGPGEQHRPAAVSHADAVLGVREHQDGAAGAEGLRERQRDDDAASIRQVVERIPATALADPGRR